VPAEGSAQNSSVLLHQGRVIGHIDHIRFFHDQFHIAGWACQLSARDSIDVHIYADHSAYGAPRGTLVLAGKANLESEPAVNRTCQDQEGGKHRFEIALPSPILAIYRGRALFVHGIRLVGGSENSLIAGSGTFQFPSPPLIRKHPAVYPRLAGAYKSLAHHPRVFMTESDLKDLTTRINSPGTFSAESFARLTRRVKADLAAKVDWDAAYTATTDTYDANGNFTGDGTRTLQWDAENRLTRVLVNGTEVARFVYDGRGTRVQDGPWT
jgi:YD repeat-containing protein